MRGFMSRFLLGFFTGVGVIAFFLILMLTISYFYFFGSEKTLPKKMILNFEFHGPIVENSNDNPFEYLGLGYVLSIRTVLESLDRAANDDRIEGIVFRTLDPDLTISQAEEIRNAVARFRQTGKFAYFYTDSFGDGGWGTTPYFLASAFDQVWMQPSGTLGIVGIAEELPFLKKIMDLVGVKAQYGQRKEYKSAPNMYLHESMPPAQVEMEKSLFDENYSAILKAISKDRGIDIEKLKVLIDEAPLNAPKALEEQFVHKLGYWDEFKTMVKEKNADIEWIKFADYVKSLKPPSDSKQKIAMIYGIGDIMRGRTPPFGLMPGGIVGGETVAKAIRQAVKDDEVIAIILRMDSPGGSYPASDMVWREVIRAKESKKPIIVSIGSVAASGGYFMAMAADRILANETSITGSIGVFSGKFQLEELWNSIGVKWDVVKRGENADMWSQNKPFSEASFKRLNDELDFIYKDFTQKVSDSRQIPPAKLDDVCKGRVWTGTQALQNGLIDQIGGYWDALRAAKKAAGIPADKILKVEIFPKAKSLAERVVQYLEDIEDMTQTSKGLTSIAKAGMSYFSPVLEAIDLKNQKSMAKLYYEKNKPIGY